MTEGEEEERVKTKTILSFIQACERQLLFDNNAGITSSLFA